MSWKRKRPAPLAAPARIVTNGRGSMRISRDCINDLTESAELDGRKPYRRPRTKGPHRQVRLSFSATAVLDVGWPATCNVSGLWEIHDPFRGDSGSHHRIVFLF